MPLTMISHVFSRPMQDYKLKRMENRTIVSRNAHYMLDLFALALLLEQYPYYFGSSLPI